MNLRGGDEVDNDRLLALDLRVVERCEAFDGVNESRELSGSNPVVAVVAAPYDLDNMRYCSQKVVIRAQSPFSQEL